jgi:putative protease
MQEEIVKSPELLLPAGSVENFRAAVEGGADAVYLGLRLFNARGRATNFTFNEFIAILEEAKEKNIKIYLTLNTVIKNSELPQLLDMLWFLSKTYVSAIIIQDWGVYYLLKKEFPKLVIHASTQMGNHNSLGANYSQRIGIKRVILARELTKPELEDISKKTSVELEYFVHGSLCYSFSGMCLFSSYLGGVGANRGLCAQPCRRAYSDSKNKFLFSLKDNQLIDEVDELKKMGIASIKIEGRMKSAEYVYTTAQSYRKALDNIRETTNSKNALKNDMGRDKTSYFFGGNVSNAITQNPNTGIYLGNVIKINEKGILFESNKELEINNRIRFVTKNANKQINFKIIELDKRGLNQYFIELTDTIIKKNDKVFLIGGLISLRFSNKIKTEPNIPSIKMPAGIKQEIVKSLFVKNSNSKNLLFLRIDSIKWMKKVWLDKIDYIIINLSSAELTDFNPSMPFIKKNINKIWIELPKFIPETKIDFYRETMLKLSKEGVKQFMLSHLSQKLLLPSKSTFAVNENVYVFNDAASKHIQRENAKFFSYPVEIDFETLNSIKNRAGIIPLYFHPDLFYSRMPVTLTNEENVFEDDHNRKFSKIVRDGVTIVRPEEVVSTLKHRPKMEKLGYSKFLIDFTGIPASKHVFNNVLTAYNKSEVIQNSTNFNFRRELK